MKNVGLVDKVIRLVLAIGFFSLAFILNGNLRLISAVGLIPLFTAVFGVCPLYSLFGISTCKVKK